MGQNKTLPHGSTFRGMTTSMKLRDCAKASTFHCVPIGRKTSASKVNGNDNKRLKAHPPELKIKEEKEDAAKEQGDEEEEMEELMKGLITPERNYSRQQKELKITISKWGPALSKLLTPFFSVGKKKTEKDGSPIVVYSSKASKNNESPWNIPTNESINETSIIESSFVSLSPISTSSSASSGAEESLKVYALFRLSQAIQKAKRTNHHLTYHKNYPHNNHLQNTENNQVSDKNPGYQYFDDDFVDYACKHGTRNLERDSFRFYGFLAKIISKM